MRTFTMNDLHKLVEIIGSSSASDDRLPAFLAKFNFPDKYETDDDSVKIFIRKVFKKNHNQNFLKNNKYFNI